MGDAVVKYEDTEYPIRNVDGDIVAIHIRRNFLNEDLTPVINPVTGKPKKTYFWSGLDGKGSTEVPLYHSEILNSKERGGENTVVLVEGEAATDALIAKGFQAVGTVTGAASAHTLDSLRPLQGYQVYLWPDNDDIGRRHMEKHAALLQQLGIECHMVDWQEAPFKGADAADLITSSNGESPAHITNLLNAARPAFAEVDQPDNPVLTSVAGSELMKVYAQEARSVDHAQKMGIPRWVSTGFASLDNIIGGGLHPGVTVIHAAPGIGKSALVLQMAIQSQVPSLLISTEMSMQEMIRRAVSQISGKPRRSLLSGSYDLEVELAFVHKILDSAPSLHITEAITTPAPSDWIDAEMAKLKAESKDGRAMLIIDSWHSWVAGIIADDPNANEHQALNMGYAVARKLSVKHSIPVIMVAERNKQSMSKTGADNSGNAIAGTRKATYGPDLVIGMDYANAAEEVIPGMRREVLLRMNKNRQGPAGLALTMWFDGDTLSFSEF